MPFETKPNTPTPSVERTKNTLERARQRVQELARIDKTNPENQAGIIFAAQSLVELAKYYPDYDRARLSHVYGLLRSIDLSPEEKEQQEQEEQKLRDLYAEYNQAELALETEHYIEAFAADLCRQLGQDQIRQFKVIVLDVESERNNPTDEEFFRKLASVRDQKPEDIRLNPHVEKHQDGSQYLVLRKADVEKLRSTDSEFRANQLNLLKHEVYHTQRDISEGYTGSFFEELCAEQVSDNSQGYKDIKTIWNITGKLFGFESDVFLQAALQDPEPLTYIRRKLPTHLGTPLTQLLISQLPKNYVARTQNYGYLDTDYQHDISEDLLYFAEKKMGPAAVEQFLQDELDFIEDFAGDNDFFDVEDLINLRCTTYRNFGPYGLKALQSRIENLYAAKNK